MSHRYVTLLAVVLLVRPALATASPWITIAAEGEDSPDGRPYGPLVLASRISDDGAVSFGDAPEGTPPSPPFTLWRWSEASGAEHVAAIEGVAWSSWARPELFANGAGDLALREGSGPAPVACGAGGTSEQVRERLHGAPRGGDPALVTATGAPAPGAPDLTIARLIQFSWEGGGFGRRAWLFPFPAPSLDPGGALTFYAHTAHDPCFLDDPGASLPAAVFAPDGAGGSALVARDGDPLPGAGDGEVIRLDSFERVAAADAVFVSSLLGEIERGEPQPGALLRWRGGLLETVVRPGEPSAFAGGAVLADVGLPASSPSGTIALAAKRAAEDGTTPDPAGAGIWLGDADGVAERWPLVGAVPGGPAGAVFVEASAESALPGAIRVNDAGEVAFVAKFRTAPGAEPTSGLFGPGADGSPVLRLTAGASTSGGSTLLWFEPLHLAEDGTLLVRAGLPVGPGVCCRSSDYSWHLLPRAGGPRLLLRETDLVEVAPGDLRSIGSYRMAYDTALTRFGMVFGVVGRLSREPTAIAVLTVPEPRAPLAGAGALVALGLRASRRRARRPIRRGGSARTPLAS